MLNPTRKLASTVAIAALSFAGGAIAIQATTATKTTPTETPATTARGFSIHTAQNGPAASQETLGAVEAQFGFVPNLLGVMAESPALVKSYMAVQSALAENSRLTPVEQNAVQLAIAFENKCQYCVAGHTMMAQMSETPSDIIARLRAGQTPEDAKIGALCDFAIAVYKEQGRVSDTQLKSLMAAGYSHQQALDVVALIAAKVMTNFTNQIAGTPVDAAFAPLAEGLPFKK